MMHSRKQMWFIWLRLFFIFERGNAMCPSICQCDDELLITSCQGPRLNFVPITLNPALKVINLRNNIITTVNESMSFYTDLRIFDASCNKIKTLGILNFHAQTKLECLNVSDNKITSLQKETFLGLISLTTLDISNNLIEHLEYKTFLAVPELQHLNLSKNHITIIGEGNYNSLKNLKSLKLDGNELLDIPTHMIQCLPTLEMLTLDDNYINIVNNDSIPMLRELKVLTLQSNVISEFHLAAFDGVQTLELLDISDNNISLVPTGELSNLQNLQDLRACGNEFTIIGPVAFQNLFDLRKLWICELVHLERIDVRAFVDNIKLETVIMDGNINLKTLPARLFHGNTLLTFLSIRRASLTSLDASHFPLDRLHYLYLGANPLNCNCSLFWLWVLTRKQLSNMYKNVSEEATVPPDTMPTLDVDDILCKNPNDQGIILMIDVPESDVQCDATWLVITAFSAAVIISVVCIASTVMYFWGTRKWCKKRETEPEVTETEMPTLSLHSHHLNNQHQHQHLYQNRCQNGALLMLVSQHPNTEEMDEVVLKHYDSADKNRQIQHPLETWENLQGEVGMPDQRHTNIINPQYSANRSMTKPAHIVYV